MFKIFVGSISPEGEHLLTTYLNVFMPDAVIEPLKPVGIKGKMKNHAKRQDVALVILDESLYEDCKGVVDDVLSLPKVHIYKNDDSLNQFLISKFGRLDGISTNETATVPPDMLMDNAVHDDGDYIPKSADIFTSSSNQTTPPDKLVSGASQLVHRVQEDDFDNLAVSIEDTTPQDKDSDIILELQAKLAKSEMLVRNLTLQLEDKNSDSDDDVTAFIGRIRELEEQLAEKDKQLASSGENSYVQLGKVARAEQIIAEFDDLKAQLRTANEDKSQLEFDKNNLSGQVDLLQTKVEELKTKVAEIEVLQEEIRGRDEELTSVRSEVENLTSSVNELSTSNNNFKSELQAKLEEISTLQESYRIKSEEFDNLSNELQIKKDELEDKVSQINKLTSDLEEKSDKIVELEKVVEIKTSELADKIAELEEKNKIIAEKDSQIEEKTKIFSEKEQELNDKCSELESKIAELTDSLNDKEKEIENAVQSSADSSDKISLLKADLDAKNDEFVSLKKEYETLQVQLEGTKRGSDILAEKLANLNDEFDKLSDEVEKLTAERDEALAEVLSKDNTIKSLETRLQNVSSGNDDLAKQLSGVEDELSESKASISTLNNELSTLKSSLSEKEREVVILTDKINQLEVDLKNKSDELDELTASSLSDTELVERINSEKASLEEQITLLSDDKSKLNIQIDELNEAMLEKDKSILELQSKVSKLSESSENNVKLEEDLTEERKKSAKLASELEVLKKTSDSGRSSELRVEIARLKRELEECKSASTVEVQPVVENSEEVERLRSELQETRQRCADLEMDIVEKNDLVKEFESSVFGRMSEVAFSKAAYDINLANLGAVPQNFICVAGGSLESNISVYEMIRKSCLQDSNRRIIVLDLATDSHVDRILKVRQVTSPVKWLEGSEDVKSFIAATDLPNVRVLAVALAYLNELALLNVNWQKRISDLSGLNADTVIINVGCLNNVISKILFNMFSKSMTSYIVTKATPINLRSVIINITGFRDLSDNVTVACVDFDEGSSRTMYQRLVAKCKARVYNQTDVLKL